MQIPNWQIYIVIALVFLTLEAFASTFFLFPLGVAALGTAAVAPFADFTVEMLVFSVITVIGFYISVKFIRPKFKTKRFLTGSDSLVGVITPALEEIKAGGQGYVKVYADQWNALPLPEGEIIAKGQNVRIEKVVGNKVFVSKVN